jgi:hypothetical protein
VAADALTVVEQYKQAFGRGDVPKARSLLADDLPFTGRAKTRRSAGAPAASPHGLGPGAAESVTAPTELQRRGDPGAGVEPVP